MCAVDRLCERYDELYGLPFAGHRLDPEVRDELIEEIWAAKAAGGAGWTPARALQECGDR